MISEVFLFEAVLAFCLSVDYMTGRFHIKSASALWTFQNKTFDFCFYFFMLFYQVGDHLLGC